jgi:hypothetical protein
LITNGYRNSCRPHASPHTVHVPTHQAISRPHASTDHMYNSLPFSIQNSNSYFMHKSNFHVTGFSHGSNTHDAVGRVSRSRANFDVAATTSRWILITTASNRASTPEFQHFSSTFGLGILAAMWTLAGGQAPPWGMPPWTIRHIRAFQFLHS